MREVTTDGELLLYEKHKTLAVQLSHPAEYITEETLFNTSLIMYKATARIIRRYIFMKSFISKFTDSAKSLGDIRTITVTGMLLALAVAIRSLGIDITADARIVFTCVPICIIAMLYGPVVCGMSTFALDIIGFLIDNKSARGYSIELALVVILSGIIYGIVLYKADIKYTKSDIKGSVMSILRIMLARGLVVVICNMTLNSYFLYSLYVNKDFSVFTSLGDRDMMNQFMTWFVTSRLPKNVTYPIDIVLLSLVLPSANMAYKSVFKYKRA